MKELFIIVITMLSIIPIVLIVYFKKRDKLDELEESSRILHNEICGLRIGGVNISEPFVRLSIYNGFVVISYWKKIIIPYDDIIGVSIINQYVKNGVMIETNNDKVIIWSRNSKDLKNMLINKTGG